MKGHKKFRSNNQKTGVTLLSSMKTSVQQNERSKTDPFRKSTKTAKDDFFDIGFEDSHDYASSCTLSQNSDMEVHNIFKHSKKVKGHKNNVSDVFDVDFEESTETSSNCVQTKIQPLSQNSMQPADEDTIINFKQPELFKNPKPQQNCAFDIDLDGTGDIHIQNMQQSQASTTSSQKSADLLLQDESKECPLFQHHNRGVNNTFEVDFEESREVSSPVVLHRAHSLSQTYNEDTTINFKQPELFKNPKIRSNCVFDINLEESNRVLTQNSQEITSASQKSIDALSQEETEKPSLFQSRKNNKSSAVNVDFEESRELFQVLPVPQSLSETCSQDTSVSLKLKLFKNSISQSDHAFNVDLEESADILTKSMQLSHTSSSSQKFVDTLSQGEAEKHPLFQDKKKRVNNAFEVDFEESCQDENVRNSRDTQDSQSSNKENIEDTSVRFANPDPFRDAKQRRLNKPFDVDFEESRNITDTLSTYGTPLQFKMLPLRKSSNLQKKDHFDVNVNETVVETNVNELTEKSITGLVMNSDSPVSTTGTSRINRAEASSEFNQSSFNDENLGQWMSDHTEDELVIEQRVEMETSYRKTLLPNEIPAPLDFTTEEDRLEQLQLKFREIVDNARSGKTQGRSPIIPRQKSAEKPKLENKRIVPVKSTLRKPAPFATKRLYNHIIGKIRPKYGIDSVVQAEELVISICDVVKMVVRRKGYQKKLINDLKVEMAKMGVIETTYQFYDFVREFLPYEFRLKAVPCIQPGTNIVYPPKDAINPFEKIL